MSKGEQAALELSKRNCSVGFYVTKSDAVMSRDQAQLVLGAIVAGYVNGHRMARDHIASALRHWVFA
jgi:hypothetical protein